MSTFIQYENARAHNDDLWRQAEHNGRLARHAVRKSARPRLRNLPGSLVRGTRIA